MSNALKCLFLIFNLRFFKNSFQFWTLSSVLQRLIRSRWRWMNIDKLTKIDKSWLRLTTINIILSIFQISKWVEDETTFCLMNLILLFSAGESRKQLKDPAQVESFQLYFTQLLHRYLCSRHSKMRARSKLAEGIRLVSHCRELHQLATLRCSMSRKISESQSSTTSSSGSEDN